MKPNARWGVRGRVCTRGGCPTQGFTGEQATLGARTELVKAAPEETEAYLVDQRGGEYGAVVKTTHF